MQHHSRILAVAPVAALLLLAGCNSEPETIQTGTVDPTAADVSKAPPVVLPPSLAASRTYRCKDNSLLYVDFYSDELTADIRTDKDKPAVRLTAPEKGKAFVADGYSVDSNAATTNITAPGKGSQSCKA